MKLDNKRTILIGFAFLAISAFWQVYDNIIPSVSYTHLDVYKRQVICFSRLRSAMI